MPCYDFNSIKNFKKIVNNLMSVKSIFFVKFLQNVIKIANTDHENKSYHTKLYVNNRK